MSLYFDNEKLFDAEGHLTDEGLYALKDGTLDDLGALEVAVILPSPALVTVMVSVVFAAVSLMEVLFKDKLPAALAMLQATVLAPVLPSAHL